MAQPFAHCDYCPLLNQKLESCPLLPTSDILFSNGSSPMEILTTLTQQNLEFFMDLLFACVTSWVYLQAPLLFLRFIKNMNIRTGALIASYGLAKLFCDIMKVIVFRELRPIGSCSSKFGLPSCHCSLVGLYLTWTLLSAFVYPKVKISKITAIECFLMILIPYSRLYLIYHSLKQIIYGLCFGIIQAFLGVWIMYLLELKWPNKPKTNIYRKLQVKQN